MNKRSSREGCVKEERNIGTEKGEKNVMFFKMLKERCKSAMLLIYRIRPMSILLNMVFACTINTLGKWRNYKYDLKEKRLYQKREMKKIYNCGDK